MSAKTPIVYELLYYTSYFAFLIFVYHFAFPSACGRKWDTGTQTQAHRHRQHTRLMSKVQTLNVFEVSSSFKFAPSSLQVAFKFMLLEILQHRWRTYLTWTCLTPNIVRRPREDLEKTLSNNRPSANVMINIFRQTLKPVDISRACDTFRFSGGGSFAERRMFRSHTDEFGWPFFVIFRSFFTK